MTEIEDLRPLQENKVIDLVKSAGIDVTDWSNFKGIPSQNPKYCYQWCFEGSESIVLNLWHDNLRVEGAQIIHAVNYRKDAEENSITNPRKGWASRGRKVDEAIKRAYLEKIPLKVIIQAGSRRKDNKPDAAKSAVKLRSLDTADWRVDFYDALTGENIIVRGSSIEEEIYSDQFSEILNDESRRATAMLVTPYIRSAVIRHYVLNRARGKCEFCGINGFKVSDGKIYLETHHVVPLHENGADSVANVIALCPNHHREAHFGEMRTHMREAMLSLMQRLA